MATTNSALNHNALVAGAPADAATLPRPIIPMDQMQREAAESAEGAALILGGPGTGKTYVMIARMIKLIRGGASPHHITYVTFSSRGAEDTRNQIARLPQEIRESAQHVFIGTLHYYASHLLRRAGASVLGLSPQFSIWDPDEMREVILEIVREHELDKQLELGELNNIIDWYEKNQAQEPETAAPAKTGLWLEIMNLYRAEKAMQNALDLSELIPNAITALQKDPGLRDGWAQSRSRHLLVDEFQDITPRQYRLVNLMTGPTRSIMAAADPNQSIYSWRGPTPGCSTQLQMDNRNIGIHLLRMNHRCTRTLTAAATFFSNHQDIKGLINDYQASVRPPGLSPVLREFDGKPGPMDQALMDQLQEQHEQGTPWEDMAIIYRSNATAGRLRPSIRERGIPFTVLGETWKEENNNTRCITSMLASALNPMDLQAFRTATAFRPNSKYRRLNLQISNQIARKAQTDGATIIETAREFQKTLQQGANLRQEIRFATRSWDELNLAIQEPESTLPQVCRRAAAILQKEQGTGANPRTDPPTARLISLSEMTPRLARETTRQHIARFLELLSNSLQPTHRSAENDDPFAHNRASPYPHSTPASPSSGRRSGSSTSTTTCSRDGRE